MRRNYLIAIVSVLAVLIILAFVHPYLFAIRYRIQEATFKRSVRLGMTKPEVLTLARRTGLSSRGGTMWADKNGDIEVFFAHFATFCYASGTAYDLRFSRDGKLVNWTQRPFSFGC